MNGWFDSPIDTFKQQYAQAVTNWQNALSALDSAYNEFVGNFDYAQNDTELLQEWNDLDNKVQVLHDTIDNANNAIDQVKNFFSTISNAVSNAGSAIESAVGMNGVRGMGVLPEIPWALVGLITAGVAGVWVIIDALREFNVTVANKKIAEQNVINAQEGKPPIPYLDASDTGSGAGGILSQVSSTTKWVVVGIIGFMLLRLMGNNHGNKA